MAMLDLEMEEKIFAQMLIINRVQRICDEQGKTPINANAHVILCNKIDNIRCLITKK